MSLAHDNSESEFARSVRSAPRRKLPVIDVGAARAGDPEAIEAVAKQWREVWEGTGFLCIVNHGIEPDDVRAMHDAAKRFHDLPLETKLRVRVTHDQKGYIPARGGLTTHSKFHNSKKLNTVECLVLATDYPPDHPDVIAGKRFYGPCPWLPEEELPGFRATAEAYMAKITALGKSLLPVWARSLDLDADFFKPHFERSYTYFRVAKYPPKNDLEDGEMGSNAHCDTGFMTFLPPANEEGIQILDTDGVWFWPEVADGAVMVNMGYFLERWTNNRFRATPHRVVPPMTNDRYSFACFVNPAFETVGECLPTCTGPDNPPQYPTMTYWEFFDWYMKNSYTHYGKLKVHENNEVTPD